MNTSNVIQFNTHHREFNRLIKYLKGSKNDNVFYLLAEYAAFVLASRDGITTAIQKVLGICNVKAELLVHTMAVLEDGSIVGFYNSHSWNKDKYIELIEWIRDNPNLSYTDLLDVFNVPTGENQICQSQM